ncbi:MAG: hypothetical protein WCP46_00675 [Alphaproteobacteria bacterium]
MADQENINFGALGLNLETSISQVKKGQWTYALNAIAEGFDGQSVNLQNEPGSQSCIEFPEGFKVIGRRPVYEKNIIIWWLANPTTKESQIGWSDIDGCTYTKRIDPSCLNLSIEHPVLQSAHRISNCGFEIYWVDGYNPDRFLNWDNLPYKEIPATGQACGTTILPEIDCNKLNINPSFAIPKIDVIAVDSDGEIKSGTVQFAIQYSNANGEGYTSYYSITNPVPIFSISNVTLDFNAPVTKSVTLSISNLDTIGYYDYFNLAVINTVNGVTTPSLIGTYQINKATETIVYTGQNTTQKALSLVEIAEKYPVYETSKIITTANDILIRADVKTVERLSYQEIANNIHLQWCRYRLPAIGFNDPLNVVNFKGYMSDEVYAFELVFQLAKGIETDGFHIPGRKYNANDLTVVSNNDTNNIPLPQWRVYNTASKTAFKDEWLNSTKTNTYKGPFDFGEFAYWESLETYPCEDQYGELKGQPIRHHKFPDNTVIDINDDQGNIYPLGVQVDVKQIQQLIANSNLTQEQKDEIVGFKIIRANRVNNKSIVAKGILRNVGQYDKDGTTYLFPNYPYNSVQPDPFISNTSYPEASKSRFTFQSPDTSFFQPTVGVGEILKLEAALYGTSQGHFQQVKNHARYKIYTAGLYLTAMGLGAAVGLLSATIGLTAVNIFDGTAAFTTYQTLVDIFERTTPFVNYAYQYNSVGNYNNSKVIPNNGNKLRILESNQYVIDGFANVNDTYTLNNYNRESSIFVKTNITLPLPSEVSGVPVDDSRYTLGCSPVTEIVNKNINCYYGSIKKANLQQYNQLYSYETVDTGFQITISQVDKQYYQIFGGDIFINKFSFKTKLRFFLDDGINKPDGTDIFYNEIGNVGSPNFWYSAKTNDGSETTGINSILAAILGTFFGTKKHQLDCDRSQFFYRTGRMYLFAYGIPTFYCESEVNVDNRQAFNNKEGDFYPHIGTGIPDDWLQAVNVPITYDNTYYYNRTYSKQNKENVFTHLPLGWVPSECKTHLPYRAVFSEDRTNNPLTLERNNWLIYKPSSYFDFPQNYGKLNSLDGIENRQVLARFDNKTFVYNALLTAPTSQAQLYLGQSLFNSSVPPLDLANTDQGFIGSRHKFLERTEYGTVTVDDIRGQVFLIQGNRPKNLTGSDSGVEQFFNKNLEVQLPKYFPGLPIDNAFNGVGITGVYDAKYNRLILTKLDYVPLDSSIIYDGGKFYIPTIYKEIYTTNSSSNSSYRTEVSLNDPKYFCNKSFTMSYDFDMQTWISLHSYIQNFYVGSSNFYLSGLNSGNKTITYNHLLNNQKYNSYNGTIAPYIVEYPFAYKLQDEILQNIKDYSKVFKYNEDDTFIETNDVYFNKCILYNNQQSSGILKLEPKPYRNMAEVMKYPKYNADSKTITYTKSDNFYQINTFWSLVRDVKKPLFIKTCKSLSYDKEINQDNMNYGKLSFGKAPLRAKDLRVRMILDDRDDSRVVSQFIISPTITSYK